MQYTGNSDMSGGQTSALLKWHCKDFVSTVVSSKYNRAAVEAASEQQVSMVTGKHS